MRQTAAILLFIFAGINALTATGYLLLGGAAALVGEGLEAAGEDGDRERAARASGTPIAKEERPSEYADDEWGDLNRDLDDLSEWAEESREENDQAEDDMLREEGKTEAEVALHAKERQAERDKRGKEWDESLKSGGSDAKGAGLGWMLMSLFLVITAVLQIVSGVKLFKRRGAAVVFITAFVTGASEIAGFLMWDEFGIFNGLGLAVAIFAVVGANALRSSSKTSMAYY